MSKRSAWDGWANIWVPSVRHHKWAAGTAGSAVPLTGVFTMTFLRYALRIKVKFGSLEGFRSEYLLASSGSSISGQTRGKFRSLKNIQYVPPPRNPDLIYHNLAHLSPADFKIDSMMTFLP